MRGNSRNNVGNDQEKSEARDQKQQNQRIKIEKAIVLAALIVILMAVLVMPKIEVYQQNKTILAEKIRYNQELPDKMTEETYLRQLQTLDEALNQTRSELPEYLDTVSLYDEIAKMVAHYVEHQIRARRDHLMAEQAFLQAALLNPRLALLVRSHEQILLQGAFQIFQVLGSKQPLHDAKVLTAIIGQMEYQALLSGAQPAAEEDRLAMLTRYMHLVLAAL